MRYYAEYLSRINSVSLSVESDECIEKLEIGGPSMHVLNEVIVLPAPVLPASVELGSSKTSLRLPCSTIQEHDRSNQWAKNPPWTASELSKQKVIAKCRHCDHVLAKSIAVWKQLPSEHWAELMDFWHCHKPHTHGEEFNPAYAVSKFEPQPSLAYVSDAYLLIHPDDLDSCPHVSGEKVWKWDVTLSGAQIESYPTQVFAASILCELIDSHAIYSFHLHDPDQQLRLLVWVFNRDIYYTSTGQLPKHGLKVMYSLDPAQFPTLYQTRGDVEDVILPLNAVSELRRTLEESTAKLPENASQFGPWKIGLLANEL